jgi:hypothetical protein
MSATKIIYAIMHACECSTNNLMRVYNTHTQRKEREKEERERETNIT